MTLGSPALELTPGSVCDSDLPGTVPELMAPGRAGFVVCRGNNRDGFTKVQIRGVKASRLPEDSRPYSGCEFYKGQSMRM